MAIEEQVYDSMKRTGIRMVAETSKLLEYGVEKVLEILYQQAMKKKALGQLDEGGEVALEKLRLAVERDKEELHSFNIGDESYPDFKAILDTKGAPFAVSNVVSDDMKTVYYLKKDAKKIEDAIVVLNAKAGLQKEISSDLFLSHFPEESVCFIDHLSEADLELFRYYASESDFVFAVAEGDDGSIKLLVDNDDREKVREALAMVSWDLTGPHGGRIRERVNYKLEGRQALNIALQDAERDFYIVNGNAPESYIHVTADDFKSYKNKVMLQQVGRNSGRFEDSLADRIRSLGEPVVLSPEEFNMNSHERSLVIEEKMNIFPPDYDIMQEQSKFRELFNLVSIGVADKRNEELQKKLKNRMDKMALDDEGNHPAEIDDDSISYSNFAGYEYFTDQDRELKEARERELAHYIASNRHLHSFDSITVALEENSLDYVMDKAGRIRETREKVRDAKVYRDRSEERTN